MLPPSLPLLPSPRADGTVGAAALCDRRGVPVPSDPSPLAGCQPGPADL